MSFRKFLRILNFSLGYLFLFEGHAQTTTRLYDSITYKVSDDAKSLSKLSPIQYQINHLDTFSWDTFRAIPKLYSVKTNEKTKIWLKLTLKAHKITADSFYLGLDTHEKSIIRFYNSHHQLLYADTLGELRAKTRQKPMYLQQVVSFQCPAQDSIYCVIKLSNMTRNYLKRDIVPILYTSPQSLKAAYNEALANHHPRIMYHFLVLGLYLFQIFWTLLQCIQWQKKQDFLYYLGYLTALFIYFFSKIDGFDHINLFFPYNPKWYIHVNNSMPVLAYWMYSRFFDHFFDIKQHYSRLYRLMQISESLLLFALVSVLILPLKWLPVQVLQQITSVFVCILVTISVLVFGRVWYDKRQSIFNMVMVGTCIFTIGATLSFLFSIPEYLPSFFQQTIVQEEPLIFFGFGVLFEMICFSIALTRKAHKNDIDLYKTHSNYFYMTHNVLKGKIKVLKDKISAAYSNEEKLKVCLLKQADDLNLAFEFLQELSKPSRHLSNLGELSRLMDRHFKSYFKSEQTEQQIEYTSHFDKQLNSIYLNMEYKLNILFFTHEAIINIYKYAGAAHQSVEFYIKILGDTIRFEIIDDGIGIPQQLQLKQSEIMLTNDNYETFLVTNAIKTNGLKSLFEKAKKLKGGLSIHSQTNKTKLVLDFPKFGGTEAIEIV